MPVDHQRRRALTLHLPDPPLPTLLGNLWAALTRQNEPLDKPTYDQQQSPFFSKLPLEIRCSVYAQALSHPGVHLFTFDKKTHGIICSCPPGEDKSFAELVKGVEVRGVARYVKRAWVMGPLLVGDDGEEEGPVGPVLELRDRWMRFEVSARTGWELVWADVWEGEGGGVAGGAAGWWGVSEGGWSNTCCESVPWLMANLSQ